MPLAWAKAVEFAALIWLACGASFALVFLTLEVQRIDPLAKGAPWGFRLLIAPGTVVFWPLLAWRWARGTRQPPVESNAHRRRARSVGDDRDGASS